MDLDFLHLNFRRRIAALVWAKRIVMLAAIAIISIVVYKWVGLEFLRRGWINLDLLWTGALIGCGTILLAV